VHSPLEDAISWKQKLKGIKMVICQTILCVMVGLGYVNGIKILKLWNLDLYLFSQLSIQVTVWQKLSGVSFKLAVEYFWVFSFHE
jgi:hypothetical protein